MKKIKDNKLLLVILVLIVIVIVLLISKFTYAYLAPESADPGITEGTITASGDRLIFTKGTDLSILASTDNFYTGSGDLETSTNPSVTLIANNENKEAKAKYSAYINISENTFVASDNTPELILIVKLNDTYYKDIDGLEFKEELNGYDITGKKGNFTLAADKEIISQNSTQGVTHNWEIKVILKNKEIDQSINENAKFNANVLMQKDKILSTTEILLANANKDNVITLYHHNTEDLIDPDMANKELIANDDSYRFSGSDKNVKNYVCLDNQETGDCASNDDLYRIIGLFKNSEGYYEMKLIKAEGATSTQLGDATVVDGAYCENYSYPSEYYKGSNYANLASYYWNRSKETDSENVNMWQESNFNKINLNQEYYNYLIERAPYLQNHITEHTWTTGGYANSDGDAKVTYDEELGEGKVKAGDNVCYTQDNTSSPKECTQKDVEYTKHIGLMYMSDYMYGALPTNWGTKASSYGETNVTNNNWLYVGVFEWVISRDSSSGNGYRYILDTGNANFVDKDNLNAAVRPTFYLSADVKIKEGDGSDKIPYRVTFE